jgi:hypothetical protein
MAHHLLYKLMQEEKMKTNHIVILAAAGIALVGFVGCYSYIGHQYYPDVPHYPATNPGHVQVLRHEPGRSHIQLGEVWIRPDPGMSPGFVENSLRERAAAMGADALVIVVDRYIGGYYWYGRRAYRERDIEGIAIRYR